MRRKYKITVTPNINTVRDGNALLIAGDGDGYLWLGDANGECIGWIDNRQLDAISKQWLRLRSNRRAERET